MPLFTLTIEDYSPFITYSSDWIPGTSANDNSTINYSQSTFMLTTKQGGTAKIAFNGTGITIYGAKRTNHGLYQVKIDGSDAPAVNGSSTPWQFQVPLFDIHGLEQGPHDVQITNQNDGLYLDIDYVTIQSEIGEDSKGKLYVVNYQDSDPSFSYLPTAAQWSTNPTNLGTYFGSTGHSTSSFGASVNFTFDHRVSILLANGRFPLSLISTGDGVSLYGPMAPNGAPYTVSLDGTFPIMYQTIRDRYLPQALLFHATNLGGGQHHLQVAYEPGGNNEVFAVDYANVYTTNPTNSSASATGSSSQSSDSNSSKSGGSTSSNNDASAVTPDPDGLSAAAAAGITVAACFVLLLSAAVAFVFFRRRKQSRENDEKNSQNTVEPYNTNGPRDYYRDLPGRPPALHIQTNFEAFGTPTNSSPTADPRRLTLPINLNKSPFSASPDSNRHTWDPRFSTAQMSGVLTSEIVSPVYRKSRTSSGLSPIAERARRTSRTPRTPRTPISPPDYS